MAAECRQPSRCSPGTGEWRRFFAGTSVSVYRRVAESFEAAHHRALQLYHEISVVPQTGKNRIATGLHFNLTPFLAQRGLIRLKELPCPIRILPLDRVFEHHAVLGLVLLERIHSASPMRRNPRGFMFVPELLDQDGMVQLTHSPHSQALVSVP